MVQSKWEEIRNYVNTHEIIVRKELNKELLIGSTSDNYLRFLERCGFVKSIGTGKKQRLFLIPEELTTTVLEKMVYNESKKIQYFRRLKLEKINKKTSTD